MFLTLLMKYCQEWSMYLVYIYNSFLFNQFLTILLLLTFIYMLIRFKLVLGHCMGGLRSCTCQWRFTWLAEELNVPKHLVGESLLANLVHTVFICNSQEALCKLLLSYFLCFSFNCYLAVPQPTLGHSPGDSLNNSMFVTAFSTILTQRLPEAP